MHTLACFSCFENEVSLIGGGEGLSLLKTRFRAIGWGDGLDMCPQLEDGSGSMRAMLFI